MNYENVTSSHSGRSMTAPTCWQFMRYIRKTRHVGNSCFVRTFTLINHLLHHRTAGGRWPPLHCW